MSSFENYSRYYNLLYREKNYSAEAEYVHKLIRTHVPEARTMLELGCGTGRYSREFARLGYAVDGVDLSETMLAEARKSGSDNLNFLCGDMRSVRMGKKYDAVTALFHVMSYQTTNRDVLDTLTTIKEHLTPQGVACFDFWYGPAVLTQRPEVRVKEAEDDEIRVTRIAMPVMHPNENVTDVNYKIFVRNKETNIVDEIQECHRMRYFFMPEWSLFLKENGFVLQNAEEACTRREPGALTWAINMLLTLAS